MPNKYYYQHLFIADPEIIQHAFKCVKNELETANTLVFVYDDTQNKMKFYGKLKQYGKWHKWDVGYTVGTAEDTGSPLMIKVKDIEDYITFQVFFRKIFLDFWKIYKKIPKINTIGKFKF